ncbi:helix-turn-helix transcriptional regulator [Chakrabartyella piscis]|uniref:helix-turn-helix transcriptional regulator n=1 Tax=Chakrabartyella piscis TaxID=2918914 RepID=UPI002958B0CE|nr:helix-turn-helix transcriptional regulator [Chakrabartyella piscis]
MESIGQMQFFSEMTERQISTEEFFTNTTLDSLERNFGYRNVVITYFDAQGNFLSWRDRKGQSLNTEEHPYRKFVANDIIGHIVRQKSMQDQLTYYRVVPRLYHATELISEVDYAQSAYVRFLEENFDAHYSVTMAFGINGYIQVIFLKSKEEGDFTEEEKKELNKIYLYMANSYRIFKKHEQAKRVSEIQDEIIATGEKAYFVADNFMHIVNYSKMAHTYLKDILGGFIPDEISSTSPCNWLSFLLDEATLEEEGIKTRIVQNYIFKIHTHTHNYSNGIIEHYYWVTISLKEEKKKPDYIGSNMALTHAEQRVADLMYHGLTYQAIADELVVSYHTVKKHVQNIYMKCGVNSRFELYRWIENKEK